MKRFKTLLMAFVMLAGMLTVPARIDADAADYSYFQSEGTGNAYVYLDGTKKSKLDFISNTDSEGETIESLSGRSFAKDKYLYLNVDPTFYSSTDREFLVSIVCYDYNDGYNELSLEYYKSDSTMATIKVKKDTSGVAGWSVATVGIDGADFSKTFSNGAHLRIKAV